MILPLEHVHDDRLEVDALDVGFAVGAAVATEVVEDDVDSLVVAIGHDRGRPIGLTHHKLHATEPGFKRDRADWFLHRPGHFTVGRLARPAVSGFVRSVTRSNKLRNRPGLFHLQ
jgi:hypothetical protein